MSKNLSESEAFKRVQLVEGLFKATTDVPYNNCSLVIFYT